MKRLIITADDLGFSRSVNESILEAAVFGTVGSASLMVNMPFAEEASQAVRETVPNLSLGLHLCLSSGKPLAPPEDIPLLVDSRGLFRHGFLGLGRLLLSRNRAECLRQLRTEFSAQLDAIDRLVGKYELRFDHIDSHQHLHVLPGLFEIVAEEARTRNLALRIPRENFGGWKRIRHRLFSWLPGGLLKRTILNFALGSTNPGPGYFGILDTGQMGRAALQQIAESLGAIDDEAECFELNTHPSKKSISFETETTCCSPGDTAFYRSANRQDEFEVLMSDGLKKTFEKNNIRLTNFSG